MTQQTSGSTGMMDTLQFAATDLGKLETPAVRVKLQWIVARKIWKAIALHLVAGLACCWLSELVVVKKNCKEGGWKRGRA